jgi:hypothetical protein
VTQFKAASQSNTKNAYLATVDDEELLVSHPVVWLHAAVKELGADIILDAVGLPTQLELCAQHNKDDVGAKTKYNNPTAPACPMLSSNHASRQCLAALVYTY